jgi:hypothetical protein
MSLCLLNVVSLTTPGFSSPSHSFGFKGLMLSCLLACAVFKRQRISRKTSKYVTRSMTYYFLLFCFSSITVCFGGIKINLRKG